MNPDTIVQVLRALMPGRRRTVTRFGRENLSHAEQRRRIVAANAKRATRAHRNLVIEMRKP